MQIEKLIEDQTQQKKRQNSSKFYQHTFNMHLNSHLYVFLLFYTEIFHSSFLWEMYIILAFYGSHLLKQEKHCLKATKVKIIVANTEKKESSLLSKYCFNFSKRIPKFNYFYFVKKKEFEDGRGLEKFEKLSVTDCF